MKISESVTFTGATDLQVNWAASNDPRPVLEVGKEYKIRDVYEESFYTEIKLVGIKGWFNSVCFEQSC